ncbi:MAG TPA: tripartite tricarboxylate transporter substrate binding protein [Usitatibacteraceae bacterium]
MHGFRFACFLLAPLFAFTSAPADAAGGAAWPQKPIRMVVAAPAGSSVDVAARILAEGLKPLLGQPVIVDNKPAAGGTIGAAEVAWSRPDGYTIYLGFNGPLANAKAMYAKLSYDPQRDFVPVILTTEQPNVLAVNAEVPAYNLKDLIALAKAKPGKLNYASVGNGSVSHLSMELLKREAGIDVVHIPFNGGPPAVEAVMGGEVQMIFAAPSNLVSHVANGKLRAIAVTSKKRFAFMPKVPTVAESGIPGLQNFEAIAWNALMAPKETPPEIIAKLNKACDKVLANANVKKRLSGVGMYTVGGSPEVLAKWMEAETVKWGEVIRATGAKVD